MNMLTFIKDKIIDFFGNFTVEEPGVGYICISYSICFSIKVNLLNFHLESLETRNMEWIVPVLSAIELNKERWRNLS